MDGYVVCICLVDLLFSSSGFGKFRALRALRAFRPLRLISRNPGMKIIVDALLGAIPQIMNTLLVSLLFFFVFAILGESFFKGGFYACSGLEEDDDSMIVTRQDCEAKGEGGGGTRT